MPAPRGFTLLESIVALIILGGVIGATMTLRSQAVEASLRVEEALAERRVADRVMALAINGMLGRPIEGASEPSALDADASGSELDEADDEAYVVRVWRGEHLGLAYECRIEPVRVEFPEIPLNPWQRVRLEEGSIEEDPDDQPVTTLDALQFSVRCGSVTVTRTIVRD
jgi:prepilin-type N-terminal cleavage/methylation domain-containing protein